VSPEPFTTLLVGRSGSLGEITLNRPEARNPLDRVTAGEVLRALELHFGDPEVRSVVIRGAGEAFCAGGDLQEMKRFPTMGPEEAYAWPEPIVAAHELMLRADKPVVAAVHGPALAGGMGLAGMCDVIVATKAARFGMPEVKIGLFPMIIVAHLSRSIPRKRLLEMMLTGVPIDAEEAWRLGFVNRVVEGRDELDATVSEYARLFEQVAPTAVRLGKRAFALMADMTADQALRAAQFLNLPLFAGEDFAEGSAAFFEKRRPVWAHDPSRD
jgi:enoyl-CoA hydratase/carnithine racemase